MKSQTAPSRHSETGEIHQVDQQVLGRVRY